MKFIRAGREELETALADKVKQALGKGSVTLLVPGGSNIQSVVALMNGLSGNNNARLTLLLTNERYGPVDHPDSNYYQMKQAGLNLHGAQFVQVLTGNSLDETVRLYGAVLEKSLSEADSAMAFFGMGADGHIAGIMPHSPAFETVHEWAVGYKAGNFTRITITPYALSRLNTVFVGAYGSEKGAALNSLAADNLLPIDQPAQLLKNVSDVVVYNDIVQAG